MVYESDNFRGIPIVENPVRGLGRQSLFSTSRFNILYICKINHKSKGKVALRAHIDIQPTDVYVRCKFLSTPHQHNPRWTSHTDATNPWRQRMTSHHDANEFMTFHRAHCNPWRRSIRYNDVKAWRLRHITSRNRTPSVFTSREGGCVTGYTWRHSTVWWLPSDKSWHDPPAQCTVNPDFTSRVALATGFMM